MYHEMLFWGGGWHVFVKKSDQSIRFTWVGFAIPIILLSLLLLFVLYQQFERISLNILERTNKDVLSQSDSIVNYINDVVYISAMQTFYDEKVSVLRTSTKLSNSEKIEGVRNLDSYGGYSSSVYSVYIYNAKSEYFYTTSNMPEGASIDFFDQGAVSLLEQINPKNRMKPVFRFIPKPYARGLEPVYTYILFEEDLNDSYDNAMIINVHADWLDTVLTSFLGKMEVLLLNDQDRVIGKTYAIDAQSQQEIESLIRMRSSDSGRFDVKNGNQTELYLYSTFGDTDWCFVRHLSRNELLRELNEMEANTYMAIFTALLLVSLLGLFTALRFFHPLQRVDRALRKSHLSQETLSVEDYVDKLVISSNSAKIVEKGYERHLRAEYLRDLLTRNCNDLEILQVEFLTYSVPFALDVPFALVLFSKDGEALFEDASSIAFTAIAVHHKDCLVCFIQGVLDESKIQNLCEQYQCCSSVGNPLSWDSDIRNSYERVLECMSYSMFEECRQLVYHEKMLDEKVLQLPRQQNYETQILTCLSQSRAVQAYTFYLQFRQELIMCRLTYIRFSLKRLYLATLAPSRQLDNSVFEEFDQAVWTYRDFSIIDEIFRESFAIHAEYILQSKEGRLGNIIQHINQIIERDYQDLDLGVQKIADELSFSPVYLGKLFRQQTGGSIADKINDIRLEKAKQLLLADNSLTIKEISFCSGFPNSKYFFTLFRKATNMTPSQWKKDHAKDVIC
ncbi:response regulator containing CheY-like receiver domain and AraC-type DNA-binding domain [Sphaerochaeta pleomorpha str. Grapes]|uniref:Response regulator containing CheY-like receiver domain and AraC-type DNA-binding domain n=1 Tax=Sphaerochaeta pleomorpha (strain ATCC BAA-1885 / DSM 22778 / Grapes) TaxID=158190 RepID=G8QTZ2_SPHPG|nr:response regulator containing CheY-like receiver domain and AraC-type DNA-binding domain [Sphaerochaeta pleomorpha str. Grapes]